VTAARPLPPPKKAKGNSETWAKRLILCAGRCRSKHSRQQDLHGQNQKQQWRDMARELGPREPGIKVEKLHNCERGKSLTKWATTKLDRALEARGTQRTAGRRSDRSPEMLHCVLRPLRARAKRERHEACAKATEADGQKQSHEKTIAAKRNLDQRPGVTSAAAIYGAIEAEAGPERLSPREGKMGCKARFPRRCVSFGGASERAWDRHLRGQTTLTTFDIAEGTWGKGSERKRVEKDWNARSTLEAGCPDHRVLQEITWFSEVDIYLTLVYRRQEDWGDCPLEGQGAGCC